MDKSNYKKIILASTYTLDLLRDPLIFYMNRIISSCDILFVEYNQVFQNLLSKESIFTTKINEFNIILVRASDLVHYKEDADDSDVIEAIDKFCQAVKIFTEHVDSQLLICICPDNGIWQHHENEIIVRLEGNKKLNIIRSLEIIENGFCNDFFDDEANSIAHIPYVRSGYISIATSVARNIARLYRSPYKVIVVDCDNTLWGGVCAEDGVDHIILDKVRLNLQSFLIKQYYEGMIICLCSKNNEMDVFEVFDKRGDMLLKREHITAHCINWDRKSTNIKWLSKLLNLSLDSFIFIDDNETECAEIETFCPEVLTILLPSEVEMILPFLKNIWAFDNLSKTTDDCRRTVLYKENFERNKEMLNYNSMHDFIKDLDVKVDIDSVNDDEISRVSQLSFRTNQFNLKGDQLTEHEIFHLYKNKVIFYLVKVTDRFGDYGFVGFFSFCYSKELLIISNLCLSCRVLGKGIEYKILLEIIKIATDLKLENILIEYKDTGKNVPAMSFLESLPYDTRTVNHYLFKICKLNNIDSILSNPPLRYDKSVFISPRTIIDSRALENKTILDLAKIQIDMPCLERLIYNGGRETSLTINELSSEERVVASYFFDLLPHRPKLKTDNFFALGGDSLIAVQILSRINRTFSIKLSLYEFYKNATITRLALLIKNTKPSRVGSAMEIKLTGLDYGVMLPTSIIQKRLWFIEQLTSGNHINHIPSAFLLIGKLDISALQFAFDRLVAAHSGLRTGFLTHGGELNQIVYDRCSAKLEIIDLSHQSLNEIHVSINNAVSKAFSLDSPPLMRMTIVKMATNKFILLNVIHHLIADGWSIGIITRDLNKYYQAYLSRDDVKIKNKDFQFIKHVMVKHHQNNDYAFRSGLEYFWQGYLMDLPVIKLPTYKNTLDSVISISRTLDFDLSTNAIRMINDVAIENHVSKFAIIFSLAALLISACTDQYDFPLGTISACRDSVEFEETIGMFAETLLVRIKLETSDKFFTFCKKMHTNLAQVIENQDVNYSTIVKECLPRSYGEPIKAMVVFQNMKGASLRLPNIKTEDYKIYNNVARFGLILEFIECNNGISANLHYSTDLYSDKVANEINELLTLIISTVVLYGDGQLIKDILGHIRQRCEVVKCSLQNNAALSAGLSPSPIKG